jgi:hypothetical protein
MSKYIEIDESIVVLKLSTKRFHLHKVHINHPGLSVKDSSLSPWQSSTHMQHRARWG